MPTHRRSLSRHPAWAIVSLLVVVSLLATSIGPVLTPVHAASRPVADWRAPVNQELPPMSPTVPAPGETGGLTLLLSNGAQQPQAQEVVPPAVTEPMSEAEIQAVLDRMPPIEASTAVTEEFKLPPQSLPPPVPGTTMEQPFPPPETAAVPEPPAAGELQVLRYAPEGEIPIAPFLNVTFDQPMVELNTLDELAAEDVPVKLTPALPGVWKWLGTQTLSFEYRSDELNRFPMATEFTAEVPAGTTSAVGGVLAEAVTWQFSTPPPRVIQSYPTISPQPRDPLLFVAFDQQIDPAAVLETITVLAGREQFALRLATEAEIAADPQVSAAVSRLPAERWVAFRADREFPADTTVTVNVGPGTPSAEGPRVTATAQSYSFQTYAPLRVVESYCGWPGGPCQPGTPYSIRFNNPLDTKSVSAATATVEPSIPGMVVSAYYDSVQISGATAGRTTYKVTLRGSVADIFGQTLGEDQEFTFTTGSADRYLTGPNQALTTLDPTAATPNFTVYSINYDSLQVRAYAVEPKDWPEYLLYLQNQYQEPKSDPPGTEVLNTVIQVDAAPDTLTETNIDLSPALDGEYGHLIVIVEKPGSILDIFSRDYDYKVQSWVQVTNIGLDAIADQSQMTAWATALTDGAPLADVALALLPTAVQGGTGADGVAQLTLPQEPATVLVGSLGDDVAILPYGSYFWDTSGWQQRPLSDELRWYVFDDRGMYRPGEEVHVKGWLRHIGGNQDGDVSLTDLAGGVIYYETRDPQGNVIATGNTELNDLAGFDLTFTVPVQSNLGYAQISFNASGVGSASNQSYWHSFQVQEFRRPEFEVTARNESTGPYYLGGTAVVAVSAQYYAGGPLPNAETTWSVTAAAGDYAPPGWDEFVFGVWTPWWRMDYGGGGPVFGDMMYPGSYPGNSGGTPLEYTARTDATGNQYMQLDFIKSQEPRPYSVMAEARVMDVNRQAWAASTSLLVHPSKLYVGLRNQLTFVEPGDPITVDVIVTDVDGNAVAGQPATLRMVRMTWEFTDGAWVEVEADEQKCEITSVADPTPCRFETTEGGEYHIFAEVRDDAERLNRTEIEFWVAGGASVPARDVTQEQLLLIPDKQDYQPGDVAKVLVQAPFATGEGLLTVSRSGILYNERFTLANSSAELQIPIEAAYIPNLNVQVDVNGAAPRLDDKGQPLKDAPPRPAYATGSLNLSIPPLSRALTVTLTPAAAALAPGEETSLALTVVDAAGQPVENAELAVVVVDEAILALSSYTLADPLAAFYAARGSNTSSTYGRSSIVLANPQDLLAQAAANTVGGLGGGEAEMMMAAPAAAPMATASMDKAMTRGAFDDAMPAPPMAMEAAAAPEAPQAQTPIAVRSNFDPLALFAPAVRTDANGQATVTYTMPDNLTRYRVMVVAATEQQFGSAQTNVTARLPLMVRPSAPRFLNFGDRFQLPVVVQNQTDAPLTVDVVVQPANLILEETQGLRVAVPANDRVEVRFPATTENVGTARVQIAAVTGAYADAANIALPVYTPATTEAFATYGVVDEGSVAQPVAQPQNVFPQFGGLEISTSSTALQALTDAMMYLQSYPFECSEQLASRVMSVASLRDVLTAFAVAEMPTPEQIAVAMRRDIDRLQNMQNFDGGWPIWQKGDESWPYHSVFVAHALAIARSKDYAVADTTLQAALDYLRNIENSYPAWYSPLVRQTLSSYALYVRQLLDDVDYAKARMIYAAMPVDEQPLEGLAFLWQVMAGDPAATEQIAEIQRRINNSAVETAGAANFFSSYADQDYVMLHSNRRTDAIVLQALIGETPESDLIPKVVRGLMAARDNGRWNNTQENVFVINAMDDYFNTFENVAPDFIARVWLGETYVAEHPYQGYSTATNQTLVPMSYLTAMDGSQDVIVQKDGEDGRLYYRLGLRYAPTDLGLDPLDMGFVIQRTYEAVDDPADVRLDEEGVWHVKAGARVRVRLSMVAVNRRYHVALVDRLPAGFEIINPDLAVSENVPQDPADTSQGGWWWWGPWYSHQNLRDAGAEAFTTYLWDGVYNYSYVTRATTPGEYIAPPAKAEEMYFPEVFGRSGSDRVVIE